MIHGDIKRRLQIEALEEALDWVNEACEYSIDGPCAGAYKDQGQQAVKAIQSLITKLEES